MWIDDVELALPLLFALTLGASIAGRLVTGSGLPRTPLLVVASALPLGLTAWSLTLFAAYLVTPEHGFASALTICAAAILWLLWSAHRLVAAPVARSVAPAREMSAIRRSVVALATALLLLCFANACWQWYAVTAHHPFGGGDAQAFWHLKARFLCLDPGAWRNMFAADLAFAHPDYPLLLPCAVALGWLWHGTEATLWPAWIALGFLTSTALVVLWFVAMRVGWTVGCVAAGFLLVVPRIVVEAAQQYADVPLMFFATLAAFLSVCQPASDRRSPLLFAGLAAGAAAWTKNEGLPLCAIVLALTAARHRLRAWPALLGAAAPLLASMIVRTMAEVADFTLSARAQADRLAVILDGIGTYAFDLGPEANATNGSWLGLWWLFAIVLMAAALVRRVTLFLDRDSLLAAIVLLQVVAYVVAYVVSPNPADWHVRTSMGRLMVHPAAIALAFAVIACRPRKGE